MTLADDKSSVKIYTEHKQPKAEDDLLEDCGESDFHSDLD